MIVHIATFTWVDSVTDADVDTLTTALTEMAAEIPALRSYVAGPNLRVRPSTVDYAVTALVDDEDALTGYLDHPAHKAVYDAHLGWMIAERHAAQLAVAGGSLQN